MRSPAPEDDAEYLHQYVAQSRRAVRALHEARASIGRVEGRARSQDGLVEAAAGGHGLPTRLRIDPRALRLGEAALGRQVAEVLRSAQDDAGRQARQIAEGVRDLTAALPEPLDETFVRGRVDQALSRLAWEG
ncbi:YbaB/EbfC family nucleoid-associated protein [Actinomadura sp. ATCC 31491]|uniref:YbaB/EbfC family nucleoid-associated protein n=1 Tax=Actinomadura luzonensis TaxID=2805427 RepID=A0ABT0FY17_9ACTN|nr:YbaB/EbfC family nucleoid-associated protein [Actinomadura luzonensis]MCK2216778.1 YbaB/EbfC family nucleoid-associated protein [Actinomadura luzonensis]